MALADLFKLKFFKTLKFPKLGKLHKGFKSGNAGLGNKFTGKLPISWFVKVILAEQFK